MASTFETGILSFSTYSETVEPDSGSTAFLLYYGNEGENKLLKVDSSEVTIRTSGLVSSATYSKSTGKVTVNYWANTDTTDSTGTVNVTYRSQTCTFTLTSKADYVTDEKVYYYDPTDLIKNGDFAIKDPAGFCVHVYEDYSTYSTYILGTADFGVNADSVRIVYNRREVDTTWKSGKTEEKEENGPFYTYPSSLKPSCIDLDSVFSAAGINYASHVSGRTYDLSNATVLQNKTYSVPGEFVSQQPTQGTSGIKFTFYNLTFSISNAGTRNYYDISIKFSGSIKDAYYTRGTTFTQYPSNPSSFNWSFTDYELPLYPGNGWN